MIVYEDGVDAACRLLLQQLANTTRLEFECSWKGGTESDSRPLHALETASMLSIAAERETHQEIQFVSVH